MTLADNSMRGLLTRALTASPDADHKACSHLTGQMSEQAFQRLYNATSGPILGYLVAVSGHHHIAEDLLQETYIRLIAHPRPAMEPDETRRYLFRIATNLLRDRWRRNDHQPFIQPTEAAHLPDLDTSIHILAVLQTLKPRERELLWLAYVEGMDHREIAAATGLQPLSIRLLLYRARKKAAGLLNPGSPEARKTHP
jgi:RNA polymerase sigma-70 factor, ECF subfamily